MITGINIFRNCIENGYPFVEAILSVYPLVDEFLLNDGGSTDGTLEALHRLEAEYPKIRVYTIPDTPNIRWDSCSNQINQLIKQACGEYIYLGNADELLHEEDIKDITKFIYENDWPVVRYQRREISSTWSKLSDEVYHPARTVKNYDELRQDWNAYGGDEFLVGSDWWIDPDRRLQSPYIIYHLYNVFPGNMNNKRRNDAEYLAPGDKQRVKSYDLLKDNVYSYQKPESVMAGLPTLCYGLTYMETYRVREELFDVEYVEELCSLNYK